MQEGVGYGYYVGFNGSGTAYYTCHTAAQQMLYRVHLEAIDEYLLQATGVVLYGVYNARQKLWYIYRHANNTLYDPCSNISISGLCQ